MIPNLLSIAGSDPSGGAGVQADLKTFSALGAYGTTVITALTAQNTLGISGVHLVPADFVVRQLYTLVGDVRLDAIKIGMLATRDIAEAVGEFLREHPHPVVLDPVMVATSGDHLLANDAVDALRRLLPLVSLVTLNIHEAARLLRCETATDVTAMQEQACQLLDAGVQRVLLTGGHLHESHAAVDVYVSSEDEHILTAKRVSTTNTHGTGCTLSSAIAALRPQRDSWIQAVTDAKRWLTHAIAAADDLDVGHGPGPVHHFHHLWTDDVPPGSDALSTSPQLHEGFPRP